MSIIDTMDDAMTSVPEFGTLCLKVYFVTFAPLGRKIANLPRAKIASFKNKTSVAFM
jgi:hypothetical protein